MERKGNQELPLLDGHGSCQYEAEGMQERRFIADVFQLEKMTVSVSTPCRSGRLVWVSYSWISSNSFKTCTIILSPLNTHTQSLDTYTRYLYTEDAEDTYRCRKLAEVWEPELLTYNL